MSKTIPYEKYILNLANDCFSHTNQLLLVDELLKGNISLPLAIEIQNTVIKISNTIGIDLRFISIISKNIELITLLNPLNPNKLNQQTLSDKSTDNQFLTEIIKVSENLSIEENIELLKQELIIYKHALFSINTSYSAFETVHDLILSHTKLYTTNTILELVKNCDNPTFQNTIYQYLTSDKKLLTLPVQKTLATDIITKLDKHTGDDNSSNELVETAWNIILPNAFITKTYKTSLDLHELEAEKLDEIVMGDLKEGE